MALWIECDEVSCGARERIQSDTETPTGWADLIIHHDHGTKHAKICHRHVPLLEVTLRAPRAHTRKRGHR